MIKQMEDTKRIILERLSGLQGKRNNYNTEFLKGISKGEISSVY